MTKRNTIYYEFWKNDSEFVGLYTGVVAEETSITTGIDTIPTMRLTIPLKNLPEENLSAYTVKVFVQTNRQDRYVFVGVVDSLDVDYANDLVNISLSHRVARMREWIMPTNYSVKNTNVSYIANTILKSPSSPGPAQPYNMEIEFAIQNDDTVEMTFASNNKLEALSEMINNTESLHWRVDLTDGEGDKIIIGNFGQPADCEISPYPSYRDEDCEIPSEKFVTMLTEPILNVDYTNHYNRAVVFCGDIGEGVFHLTLKEVYENPSLQIAGFPVGMYDKEINLEAEPEYDDKGKVINNEKVYKDNEFVAFANNTNREYYVTDSEQLSADSGIIRHTTFNFSDLYPIPKLTDKDDDGNDIEYAITDDDRKEMAVRAYKKAIRELKAQRPERVYQFNCTKLPIKSQAGGENVVDGSKLLLTYSKNVSEYDECEDTHTRTSVNINQEFYMTRRVISFDDALNEYTTITLDTELRPRAVNAVELELREAISDGYESKPQANKTASFNIKVDTNPRNLPDGITGGNGLKFVG